MLEAGDLEKVNTALNDMWITKIHFDGDATWSSRYPDEHQKSTIMVSRRAPTCFRMAESLGLVSNYAVG